MIIEGEITVSEDLFQMLGAKPTGGKLDWGPQTYQDNIWNRFAADSIKEELEKHHRLRIPWHFQYTPQRRYGFKKRSKKWILRRRRVYHSQTDLKASGTLKSQVEGNRQITTRGSWRGSSGLVGTLRSRYTAKRIQAGQSGVTPDIMLKEMQQITDAEKKDINEGFAERLKKRARQFRAIGRRRFYKTGAGARGLGLFGGYR